MRESDIDPCDRCAHDRIDHDLLAGCLVPMGRTGEGAAPASCRCLQFLDAP